MQKSFVDRIFPHSEPLLPRHEQRSRSSSTQSRQSTPGITLQDISKSSTLSWSSPKSSTKNLSRLQLAPLSASAIHHDDPFMAIERAAKVVQSNIQAFLDAQTEGLENGSAGEQDDELSSLGSITPTASVLTPFARGSSPATVPVRQPKPRKITLKRARKGLYTAMHELSTLKSEELRIVNSQMQVRDHALEKAEAFGDRKAALLLEMTSAENDGSQRHMAGLRQEASDVEAEILDLEDKLLTLRARHNNLIQQADQVESTIDSKLSSYKSSVALVDQKVKEFLRHPPIHQSLPSTSDERSATGMYALKAERRTLKMATEQWVAEKVALSHRGIHIRDEQQALLEGEKIWRNTVEKITAFEKELRAQTSALSASSVISPTSAIPSSTDRTPSMEDILTRLDDLISHLENSLEYATARSWNLIICCIAPELETFSQARDLLLQTRDQSQNVGSLESQDRNPGPVVTDDLVSRPIHGGDDLDVDSPSQESNRSLEDTLKEFNTNTASSLHTRTEQISLDGLQLDSAGQTEYVSEDEDAPALDLLVSK